MVAEQNPPMRLDDSDEQPQPDAPRPPLPVLFHAGTVDRVQHLTTRSAARRRVVKTQQERQQRVYQHLRDYDRPIAWDAQIDQMYDTVHAALSWLLIGPEDAIHAAAQHITVELFGAGWRLPHITSLQLEQNPPGSDTPEGETRTT